MPPATRLRRLAPKEVEDAEDGERERKTSVELPLPLKRRRREGWSCTACTLLNADNVERCGLCGLRRGERGGQDREGEREEEREEREEEEGENRTHRPSSTQPRQSSPLPFSLSSPSPPSSPLSLSVSSTIGRLGESLSATGSPPVPPSASSDWCSVYRPASTSDLSVHVRKVAAVREWLELNTVSPPTSPAALRQQSVLLLTGPAGCGKCFARGTVLRLMSGDTIAVEAVRGGEQLMGDDGLPRIVTPGSLVHYEPQRREEGEVEKKLYRIDPLWSGASSFTVNGAHILVLANNNQPRVQKRNATGEWQVKQWLVTADNRMTEHCSSFHTEGLARAELDLILQAGWQPVEWEVSVDQFRSASFEARRCCQLIASDAITFNNPHLLSLHQQLALHLSGSPTSAQVDYMAWWLGVWMADGLNDRASVLQGRAPSPELHHQHRISTRLLEYQQLFHQPVHLCDHTFHYGTSSVAYRVLRAYGLLDQRHIPRALICDCLSVRRRFMAGLIDSDGECITDDSYELHARHRHVIVGYKELAATLGLRNGSVQPRDRTNQQTGQQHSGYSIVISGQLCDVAQYCIAASRHCAQPGTVGCIEKHKGSRCYDFTIDELPSGEYFGFAVHGGINRRFLLHDYTVTHNVSRSSHTSHSSAHRSHPLTVCTVLWPADDNGLPVALWSSGVAVKLSTQRVVRPTASH